MEAVTAITGMPDNILVLLRDFHLFLQDPNPVPIRALKDALTHAKTTSKCVVILGCRRLLPPEIEREFVTVDLKLPGKQELGVVLDGICESAKLKKVKGDEREQILDAASGLTCAEAENAFALSVDRPACPVAIGPSAVLSAKAPRFGCQKCWLRAELWRHDFRESPGSSPRGRPGSGHITDNGHALKGRQARGTRVREGTFPAFVFSSCDPRYAIGRCV